MLWRSFFAVVIAHSSIYVEQVSSSSHTHHRAQFTNTAGAALLQTLRAAIMLCLNSKGTSRTAENNVQATLVLKYSSLCMELCTAAQLQSLFIIGTQLTFSAQDLWSLQASCTFM